MSKMYLAVYWIVASFVSMPWSSWAFAPSSFRPAVVTRSSNKSTTSSSLSALLPEHVDALTSAAQHVEKVTSLVMNHMPNNHYDLSSLASSTTSWLADTAADAAATEQTGWWKAYLNIFKTTLLAVHSTIDPPLRSVGITQTWGISIALFTAGVRSLLIPLSIQQIKSAEYMKALKPYQDEIKEKFKDNKDAQNRAVGRLYEDANQNPLAGCLLSLAQLPIFLGLYRGVRLLAMDGKLEEPFLFIPSLEGPVSAPDYRGLDWLTQGWTVPADGAGGGLPTPPLGWETTLAFLIMPVILVLGQSVTMRVLTPPVDTSEMSEKEAQDADTMSGVLKFLPLMIGFFSLQVPAGLTIYWFTSNVFSLSQSLAVKKYYEMNPPQIELPDYWDSLGGDTENMTAEERRRAAQAGFATGPSFEDLLTEANFHYVVQRQPLRSDSEAWERVQSSGSATIPPAMASWVGSDDGSSTSTSHASTNVMETEKETTTTTTTS